MNIEQGISKNEGNPSALLTSKFNIPCSIFDIHLIIVNHKS